MSSQRIKSPCVGLCSTVYGDLVCRGCKRFHHEVVNWNRYGDEEKRAVLSRLEVLLAQVMMAKLEVFDQALLRSQRRYPITALSARSTSKYGLKKRSIRSTSSFEWPPAR